MALKTRNIHTSHSDMQALWPSIEDAWKTRGGLTDIVPTLLERLDKPDKLTGQILYANDVPVGVFWVEKLTHNYGNVFFHSTHPAFREALVSALFTSEFLNGVYSELIHFEDTLDYRKFMIKHQAYENPRQRMGRFLTDFTIQNAPDPLVTYLPTTEDMTPLISAISAHGHQLSRDYVGYPGLEDTQARAALQTQVFSGFYGQVVTDASLSMYYQGKLVGSVLIVEIACWGYDKVPWVFDISIDAAYQGKGLGIALMIESMQRLKALDYPVIGLAVTLTNAAALRIYEKLGYMITDAFTEYLYPNPEAHT